MRVAYTQYDVPLMAKCLRQRWGVTPEKRVEIAIRLAEIAADPNTRPKFAASAAKALVAAKGFNTRAAEKLLEAGLIEPASRLLEL